MYAKYLKRPLDFVVSAVALILLFPVLLLLAVFGAIAMRGNPFFVQKRPGKKGKDGQEKIFKLIKFRTMSNAKDNDGNLLPDDVRLNKYGKFLRSTSLDELPELINIVMGDLALVGPRPQLVRDMVFMTERQRKRHNVRPGLTGLAQCNGRNNISWEEKFEYDLKYIENISFVNDLEIVLRTVSKVFKREDIVREGTSSDMDFGDWLLKKEEIQVSEYTQKQNQAKELLRM